MSDKTDLERWPDRDPVITRLDTRLANGEDLAWWELAAFEAHQNGHHFTILDRQWADPYLSRFWLTPPVLRGIDGVPWESRNSVLLHYFHKADDAGALHDHPWPFKTTVLAGGYVEERFDKKSHAQHGWGKYHPDELMTYVRAVGAVAECNIDTPHRVVSIEPGTWTMVVTGAKYDHEWGFYPEGGDRVGWREYLQVTDKR